LTTHRNGSITECSTIFIFRNVLYRFGMVVYLYQRFLVKQKRPKAVLHVYKRGGGFFMWHVHKWGEWTEDNLNKQSYWHVKGISRYCITCGEIENAILRVECCHFKRQGRYCDWCREAIKKQMLVRVYERA